MAKEREPLQIYDRETGELVEEKNGNETLQKMLEFIYEDHIPAFLLREGILGQRILHFLFSKGIWIEARRKRTRKKIERFIENYNVDLGEALVPENGFRTYDAVFTRKLKEEARPIDNNEKHACIPADSRVRVYPEIHLNNTIFDVKGVQTSVENLLRDKDLAEQYEGGSAAVFRLAPEDYHRFHSPFNAEVLGSPRKIRGKRYSVSPTATDKKPNIPELNRRKIVNIESEYFKQSTMVIIGAVGVFHIDIHPIDEDDPMIRKGEEMGLFHLGGSMIIQLFEKGAIQFNEDLIKNTEAGYETLCKMGQSLGRAHKS